MKQLKETDAHKPSSVKALSTAPESAPAAGPMSAPATASDPAPQAASASGPASPSEPGPAAASASAPMIARSQAAMQPAGHPAAALVLPALQASGASQHARPYTTAPPDALTNAASDDIPFNTQTQGEFNICAPHCVASHDIEDHKHN